MKTKILVLSTGLALFSMFFGSGNLVFPLLVGQLSNGHTFFASLGIILTGVFVPFLGILAMLLFQGNTNQFFSRLGPSTVFWFSLLCLSIMGPFGVLARCITVSHGAFSLLLPNTPLWLFSFISCVVLFLLTMRKNRIIPLLGSIMTPILLLSLAAITFFAIYYGSPPVATKGGSWESFKVGFFQGYQTMDLLAAFFFSTFAINHLREKAGESFSLSVFFKSALLGGGMLAALYFVLVLLGAMYAPQMQNVPAPELLSRIAFSALGPYAAPVVCTAIILACLTTAMVLTSLFSEFLRKDVVKKISFSTNPTELSQNRISPSVATIATLLIGFGTSTLGFYGIMSFIGPLLEIIYPALIVLTLLNISYKLFGWTSVRTPTAIAFLAKVFSSFA